MLKIMKPLRGFFGELKLADGDGVKPKARQLKKIFNLAL